MTTARKQSSRNLGEASQSRLSKSSEKRSQAAKRAPTPLNNCNFRVLIGKQELGFCQVSRLESGRAALSQEGDLAVQTLAEETVPLRLVILKRALTQSKALYQWWSNSNRSKRDLRDLTVQQLDRDAAAVVNTWLLHDCLPRRWSGPEFNALGDGIAYEEIEFTYERLEWV